MKDTHQFQEVKDWFVKQFGNSKDQNKIVLSINRYLECVIKQDDEITPTTALRHAFVAAELIVRIWECTSYFGEKFRIDLVRKMFEKSEKIMDSCMHEQSLGFSSYPTFHARISLARAINALFKNIYDDSSTNIHCKAVKHYCKTALNLLDGQISEDYIRLTVLQNEGYILLTNQISLIEQGLRVARETFAWDDPVIFLEQYLNLIGILYQAVIK